jgi:hypothetical protein
MGNGGFTFSDGRSEDFGAQEEGLAQRPQGAKGRGFFVCDVGMLAVVAAMMEDLAP